MVVGLEGQGAVPEAKVPEVPSFFDDLGLHSFQLGFGINVVLAADLAVGLLVGAGSGSEGEGDKRWTLCASGILVDHGGAATGYEPCHGN